jgi:hypothetical protein
MIGCAESPTLTHVDGLGSLSFPNSGLEEAQEPFLRGVLLLHSFEFEPAREAFSEAQDADSLFALAYWGEAMANNYPLWQSKNVDEGRAILARMDSLGAVAPSHRETMYIEAVRALYGDGTKTEQDLAYMESMKALQDMHPEDHEARATSHICWGGFIRVTDSISGTLSSRPGPQPEEDIAVFTGPVRNEPSIAQRYTSSG